MTFPIKARLIAVKEYQKMMETGILTWEDKVELIEGQIIEMSPVGSKHASFVKRINAMFSKILADEIIISVQDPIVLTPYSEPVPDIALLKLTSNYYEDQLPQAKDVLLVIEVADSSLQYDREVKLALYAKAGIQEFWIINIQARNIEAYHTPVGDHYKYLELIEAGDDLLFRAFDKTIPAEKILA